MRKVLRKIGLGRLIERKNDKSAFVAGEKWQHEEMLKNIRKRRHKYTENNSYSCCKDTIFIFLPQRNKV